MRASGKRPALGAVVPTYNRVGNLGILLASLARQTFDDFVVIVADDGSTDGTRAFVEDLESHDLWRGRLFWVGCGRNKGVRTGRARNIGAANLPRGTHLLLMLDSDLLLAPTTLENLLRAQARYPGCVALGRVDWLPPLERSFLDWALERYGEERVRNLVPRIPPRRVEGTFVGPELRTLFDSPPGHPVAFRPEWALPLLTLWPVDRFWEVGGFDEGMTGYGYQDNELGIRAYRAGLRCLPVPEAWSLHVWHAKPRRAMAENQRNLDFVLRRHGPQPALEVDVDWGLWWHYHAERGGRLVRAVDGKLWAVNRGGTHRLQLDDERWSLRLGFPDPPSPSEAENLSSVLPAGVAYDPDECATR